MVIIILIMKDLCIAKSGICSSFKVSLKSFEIGTVGLQWAVSSRWMEL